MASVAPHISLLAEVLMAAAHADSTNIDEKVAYVRDLLAELLCTSDLPQSLQARVERFDPVAFNLSNWAVEFRKAQPMRAERVVELVSYVMLADGDLTVPEGGLIRALARSLSLEDLAFAHLLPADMPGPSDSFVDMAPVPLPRPRH